MIKAWERLKSEHILDTVVFRVREDAIVSPRNGHRMNAYVLETGQWINVVPITPDEEVVMVKQYRFGTEEVTLEIPGGLVDAGDENLGIAARRELREETGYDSEDVSLLGAVRPNPAIQTTTCYCYLAENVRPIAEQDLDPGEDILIERVPLDDIPRLIREGVIDHSLVLNAFHYLELRRG